MGSGKGPVPEAGIASELGGGRGLMRERTFFPPRGEGCGKVRARRDGTGTLMIPRSASPCPEEVKMQQGMCQSKGQGGLSARGAGSVGSSAKGFRLLVSLMCAGSGPGGMGLAASGSLK